MRAIADKAGKNNARAGRGGFTLIELLVVMFILAILVAIVVSVSSYVTKSANEKETRGTQALVMEAIQSWHDADPNPTTKSYPPDEYVSGTYVPEDSPQILVNQLTGVSSTAPVLGAPDAAGPQVKAAKDILLKLPRQAWAGLASDLIKDAWGVPMRYEQAGGLGGRPVLISAGADKVFGSDDDIRSDEKQ
ncbi:MAG: prepilin-type N-terminal cleavage/methylation domain-containing protein [Phycisphaerae bacterium]|jgi:prepilin-type N-terminal cleavage/methylation domain-containing protein